MQVWDTHAGTLLREFPAESEFLEAAALAPRGDFMALSLPDTNDTEQRTLAVVALRSPGDTYSARLRSADVTRLIFSRDSRYIAIAGNSILLWDIARRRVKDSLSLPGILYQFDMSFSPDNHLLAAAVAGDSVMLWDVTAGKRTLLPVDSSVSGPRLSFSSDARWLLVATENSGCIFETQSNLCVSRVTVPARYDGAVAVSADGARIAVQSQEGVVALLNTANSVVLASRSPGASTPLEARFSPDGQYLGILDAARGTLSCLKSSDGSQSFTAEHRESLWEDPERQFRFAFSPDSRRLATGRSKIRVWPLE